MPHFIEEDPSLEDYWRAIILFGRNVASYKFALGQSLIGLAAQGREFVTLEEPAARGVQPEAPSGPLAGRSFVFTGKMAVGDRKSSQRTVRELGGETPAGVTRDLDFLVVGDEGSPLLSAGRKGSKLLKAERYAADGADLRVISEAEFLAMARAAGAEIG